MRTRKLTRLLLGLVLLAGIGALFLYLRYGGGRPYIGPASGTPVLPSSALEVFFQYPEPIGNVAATPDSGRAQRVFFTVHPESRPETSKLLEIRAGQAVPFPDVAAQATLRTPLGLFADRRHRLWVVDHGNHGLQGARLLAFDLRTNRLVHEYTFPGEVAEWGSFFNDLTVTPDGRYVLVADVSFFGKKPSLVVYDVARRRARSLLDGHASVTNQGFLPVTPAKPMRFFGGLVDLMPGIDGLDVDPTGRYVYYAAMSHSGLYRVPLAACIDTTLSAAALAAQVQRVSGKPLSDGIRVDAHQNVYITDVEHQGLAVVTPTGQLRTLLRDPRIRWADGLSFGGDGYCYLADSDIPDQMLQSKAHMQEHQPYYIFRFKPQAAY